MTNIKILEYSEIPNIDSIKYIYHLIKKSKVVYVGQTFNLRQRIHFHRSNNVDFDEIFFKHVEKSQANNEEAKDIVKYNPSINIRLPTNDFYKSIVFAKKTITKRIGSALDEVVFSFYGKDRKDNRYKYIEVEIYNKLLSDVESAIDNINSSAINNDQG